MLSRTSARDAIEEYCRSYMEEEGLADRRCAGLPSGTRPRDRHGRRTAAGSPSCASPNCSGSGKRQWSTLMTVDCVRVPDRDASTKSYKLIAIRALLHDGALRSGDDIRHNAETSRQVLLADPRLARDVPIKEFPDLAAARLRSGRQYWRNWPIAHLTGTGPRWPAGEYTVPSRSETDRPDIRSRRGVRRRLRLRWSPRSSNTASPSHVLEQGSVDNAVMDVPAAYSDGHPVIRLDRRQKPDLPSGNVTVHRRRHRVRRITSRKARSRQRHAAGCRWNALPGLLRGWFGPSSATQVRRTVKIEQVDGTLLYSPTGLRSRIGPDIDYVPLFGDYTVACGPGAQHRGAIMRRPKSPSDGSGDTTYAVTHFVCFAHGDSMDGGAEPIRHGDPSCSSNGSPEARPETTSDNPCSSKRPARRVSRDA